MMVGAGVGFGHEDGCWGRLVGLDAMLVGGVSLDTMLGAGRGRLGTILASLSSHPVGD